MNILTFYKWIEKLFNIVYRNEITIYAIRNQNHIKKIIKERHNNFTIDEIDISKLLKLDDIQKISSLSVSKWFKNTLNPESYKDIDNILKDWEEYVISLSVFNYNKSICNNGVVIVNKSNYKTLIIHSITNILDKFEKIILWANIWEILWDEMWWIYNITTIWQSFYQIDFKKIYQAINFLYKINPKLKKRDTPFLLWRLNIVGNMVFDATDKYPDSTLQVIFFLHIKWVPEKELIKLFNKSHNNHLSSKILSLTNNILNVINFKNISISTLNKIWELQFNNETFIKLIPINKSVDLDKYYEENDISIEKVREDFNKLIKIQETIFINNIKRKSLKNINILKNHFANIFIKQFINNIMLVSEDNINYKFLIELLSLLDINHIISKHWYEVTTLKNLWILINNIKWLNIEKVIKKIKLDEKYKEDKLIMKPLLRHLNKKIKKEDTISVSDINKFIFIYFKKDIFKNITKILSEIGYKKSILKVWKNIILKLLDNDEWYTNLFHRHNLEKFSKEIYWYKKNIINDKNIINRYISSISKWTIIWDDYRQNIVNILYWIYDRKKTISYNSLKKLNSLFLISEKEIWNHNTYMDRHIYFIEDTILLDSIILNSDTLVKIKDILWKISLGTDFLRNLWGFDFWERVELKEITKNHINSIIKEIKWWNMDIANSIPEYINNFETTLLEYKKYSKKDLKHYLRNRKWLDNSLTYIQLINKTFDWDTDFFNKLKTLTKNITSWSMPHIKSSVFYRKNQLLIDWFDRLKELIWTKDKKWDAINPGKMFKYIKSTYPDVIENIKNNIPPSDKIIKDLLYKYDKNTKNIITFYVKLENILNEQYWCAWDYSNCCMGHNYDKQKTYIWDKGFHIINIYMNNKVIANSLVFISYINWIKTLVLDSFEKNSTYINFIPYYKEYFINYIEHLKCVNWCKDVILSWVYDWKYNILFTKKRDKINDTNIKPLWINYFLVEQKSKKKTLFDFNNNMKLNNGKLNLFQKFKEYCYSDFNINSIYWL